jgi:hypothetical protein
LLSSHLREKGGVLMLLKTPSFSSKVTVPVRNLNLVDLLNFSMPASTTGTTCSSTTKRLGVYTAVVGLLVVLNTKFKMTWYSNHGMSRMYCSTCTNERLQVQPTTVPVSSAI